MEDGDNPSKPRKTFRRQFITTGLDGEDCFIQYKHLKARTKEENAFQEQLRKQFKLNSNSVQSHLWESATGHSHLLSGHL